ncbi:MAG TPA: acyltransferase [Terriglobales bacterium]|nr:acyltransferase [Terriglobales bacterium]
MPGHASLDVTHGVAVPLLRAHMPELDSLRGLAILLVLIYHGIAPPLHAQLSSFGNLLLSLAGYGWIGVNLFFVLSGFLITGILIDKRNQPGYFRDFYTRRMLRILPALYATLLVLLAAGWISWRFFALGGLFLANCGPLLGVPLQYGPLWSLAVEEHFYIVWPWIVRRWSSRGLMLLLAAISLVTPWLRAANFILSGRPANLVQLYTWFNLDGLAMGAILAVWLREPRFRRAQLVQIALPLLTGGVVAFFLFLPYPLANAAGLATALNVGSTGLLSCVLLVGTNRWAFLVNRPVLQFLGYISYGLYLVHVLAFRVGEILFSRPLLALISSGHSMAAVLLRALLGSVLAITVAFLSRRSLEERFLRMGLAPRLTRAQKAPAQAAEKD